MKIKKGDKFLCIKDVIMCSIFTEEVVYNEGNVYTSEQDGCITNNKGNINHSWEESLITRHYFKRLKDVDRMYTKATDRLRELHRNFTGKKLGNTDNAVGFYNKYMNHKDFSFSAQSRSEEVFYYKYGYDYVSEEVFIKLNGLEKPTTKEEKRDYDEDPYNWVNNGLQNIPVKEVFNPKPYYDNSKGSLYKVATERGWNAYLFDLVKRLERGGKKDPLRQEIEKSIDVLKIWLNEID